MIAPWENGGQEVGGEMEESGHFKRAGIGKNMQIYCHLIISVIVLPKTRTQNVI